MLWAAWRRSVIHLTETITKKENKMKTKFRIVIAAVTACLAMTHVKAYGQNIHVVSGAAPDEMVSFDAESEGTSTQAIHTTFDDEIRWAKAHGMEDFNFRSEPRGIAFIKLLKSISNRYGYPYGAPFKVRIVSVKGEYPGDDKIPGYLRIYDGPEFAMEDYGEVIIRTDSAICEAFSYGRRAPYYDMGRRARSMGIGSLSNYPTGAPSMVICIIPKDKSE